MAADRDTDNRLRKLEREVADLSSRLEELVRLLKRAEDQAVQYAARRSQ